MQRILGNTLLVCGVLGGISSQALYADVSGTVYRDLPVTGSNLNSYGIKENNERGVAGITVTVTDNAGNVVGAPVTTDVNGTWSVSGTSGEVRVAFSDIPNYLRSSPVNTGSNTTVQFISDGGTADLGLFNPSEYVSSVNPDFLTAAYVNGDPLNNSGNAKDFDTLFRVNNTATGSFDPVKFIVLAQAEDVGAVWGMAYQATKRTVFSAALLKRHMGLGSLGIGGIYETNIDNGTTTPWLDVNTLTGVNVGVDPRTEAPVTTLPGDRAAANHDINTFAAVAKRGLGDIDLSEDGKVLYAVNLAQRSLLSIDVATKQLLGTPISIQNPDSNCPNDDFRPFGLGVKDGKIYIGAVCSAETSRDMSLLRAYLLRLNGTSFDTILNFPLNFERGIGYTSTDGDWEPWARSWADVDNPNAWPTHVFSPLFADIAFDSDGSLVLGFMDRAGHQLGAFNYPADSSSTNTGSEGLAQGDVYRACPDGSGGWTLESNGSCGGVTTAGAGNNEGPGGGEFYLGDFGRRANMHQNSGLGGVAIVPGSGRVAVSLMDPLLYADFPTSEGSARQMGIKWLSNTTGEHLQGVTLVPYTVGSPGSGNPNGTFSKANGLGELELVTDAPPLEIGNRVWDDTNGNGVQDAGEAGIDGVTVTLNCGGSDFTQQTANGGQYLFTDANVSNGIPRGTQCTISVPTTVSGKSLTIQNTGLNEALGSNPDAGSGSFSFTTGAAGDNNHTYDIGYRTQAPITGCKTVTNSASISRLDQTDSNAANNTQSADVQVNCTAAPQIDLELAKTVAPTQGVPGDTAVYTLVVTNQGSDTATDIVITDALPNGMSYVSATGGTSNSESNGVVTWEIDSLAANANEILTVTVQIQ